MSKLEQTIDIARRRNWTVEESHGKLHFKRGTLAWFLDPEKRTFHQVNFRCSIRTYKAFQEYLTS